MKQEISQQLKALDHTTRTLRGFGLTVGGVFGLIALYIVWRAGWDVHGTGRYILLGLSAGLVLPGLLFPRLLKHVYTGWMALAFFMGFVMTRVLLTLIFFALVTPIGFIMRLFGHDPLRRKPFSGTGWIPRDTTRDAPERMRRSF